MSTDGKPMTKAQRREAERAQALAIRAAQERRDKRVRIITMSALVVGLLGLVGVGVYLFRLGAGPGGLAAEESFTAGDPKPITEVESPSVAQEDGGISVGQAKTAGSVNENAVQLGLYLDYMCPACGQFESSNAAEIDEMVASGSVTVIYHPIAILDRLSMGTGYSSRSAAVSAYVAEHASAQYPQFHANLFAKQPEEGSRGLTNAKMAEIARGSGVPAEVADKIADGTAVKTYGEWVTAHTEVATTDTSLQSGGRFSTPTITINGVKWDGNWNQPGALREAINEVSGKTPAPSPTPSPAP